MPALRPGGHAGAAQAGLGMPLLASSCGEQLPREWRRPPGYYASGANGLASGDGLHCNRGWRDLQTIFGRFRRNPLSPPAPRFLATLLNEAFPTSGLARRLAQASGGEEIIATGCESHRQYRGEYAL